MHKTLERTRLACGGCRSSHLSNQSLPSQTSAREPRALQGRLLNFRAVLVSARPSLPKPSEPQQGVQPKPRRLCDRLSAPGLC